KLAGVIEKALAVDGINIHMNNREHAGQVVDHLHVHIIPRFKGDGFKLWHQSSYKKDEAVSVQTKILSRLP
ncbi:MAG: HIT family protein, partial [Patescibacteria group bacterium]